MPWMSNSTYEEQIEQHGSLIYTNVGDSMLPLMREHRDLLIIEKRPEGRCKKFDIVLYRRPSGKHILHRIIKVRKDDYIGFVGDDIYVDEKTQTELARERGGCCSTVCRTLHRAEDRLRRYLRY